jgi:uncharacterized protein (TIGR02996 family)
MTSLSHREAFITAIVADPVDDTLRLVFADWLEEQGDPQGEFIRIQVELHLRSLGSRTPTACSGVPSEVLQARAVELFARHIDAWEKPLRDLGPMNITWERGLPVKVALPLAQFLERWPTMRALAPLTRLDLGFNCYHDVEGARHFAASPHLTNLTHLRLLGNVIGDVGVLYLAASPHLTNLTHLDLRGNDIGDEGVRHLAASPHFKKLTHLGLAFNVISDVGVRHLATSPHLTHLTHLDLSGNHIDEGMAALAAAPQLSTLTHLDLSGNYIRTAGARHLADGPHLTNLIRLDLRANIIGPTGLQTLAVGSFRQDMQIYTNQFSGTFADFQRWERTQRRINPDLGAGRGRGGRDD